MLNFGAVPNGKNVVQKQPTDTDTWWSGGAHNVASCAMVTRGSLRWRVSVGVSVCTLSDL